MKVLLADADREFSDMLSYVFQRDGYSVITAFDGQAAVQAFQDGAPDLIILGLIMPKRSGLDVLRDIRRMSEVPIVVLSSLRDEESTVHALEAGADDYLAKPFRPRELRARIKALLRRAQTRSGDEAKSLHPLLLGDIQLNAKTQQVAVLGKQVKLTPTEFALLQHLMINHDQVLSSSDLIASVWGFDAEQNEELVRVTISRLRHKIEPDPSSPRYIVTVPGVGYRFVYRTQEEWG